MKKMKLYIALMFFLFTCCVSQTIQIDSEPKGATVHYNGVYIGETPCEAKIKSSTSNRTDNVMIQKKGYETVNFNLRYDEWADIPGCLWVPIVYPGIGIPSIWLNAPGNNLKFKLIPRQMEIIIKEMPSGRKITGKEEEDKN